MQDTRGELIGDLSVPCSLRAGPQVGIRRRPGEQRRDVVGTAGPTARPRDSSLLYSRTRVPRPMRPLTLSLSPGGEGVETAPSPSEGERVGVRVAHVFTHDTGIWRFK